MKKVKLVLLVIVIVLFSGNCFAGGSVQFHMEVDRDPGNQKVFTLTVDHFSKWDYGKNYFFLDLAGKDEFKTEAESMYFEYHTYLSVGKIFGIHVPIGFIKESFIAGQYNDSDKDVFGRVFLWGLSADLDLWLDMLSFSAYLRDQIGQDDSYHFTLKWCENFEVYGLKFSQPGFADYWKSDSGSVFISEPQIRLKMSSFFPKGFLSQSAIGSEVEITHDFFGSRYGWEINPTVFWMFEF